MPNWCDNRMTLNHEDVSKIDALEAEMSKKNAEGHSMAQPFQHLCPNPSGEWDYAWSCNNWGTKWDANIIDWDRTDDNTITIYCDTAWSPPTTLYEYLTEQGWVVDAVYHEPGMGFIGLYTSESGDDYYEYNRSNKDSIDDLPQDCIDFAGLEDAHEEWLVEAMDDYLSELERTEWYVGQDPAYVGRYEVTTEAWDYPQYCEWNGKNWERWVGDEIKVTKWRGLEEEFTDVKYQEMLDTIAENN